ncbi:MAG: hypothetical protein OXK78_05550 [Caldilineaceae bacterium]|nr:hypothetical protein [Caldilineaceae bacterium]
MKRFLLVIALLAVLVPGALLAQEEMTLGDLTKLVTALTVDMGLFSRQLTRTNARIDILEEQVAALKAQPTPAATGGRTTGDPCIVISASGSIMAMGNQLRPETLDAYLNTFGSALEDVSVKYARFHPKDGILEVRYTPLMDFTKSLEIVERWRGCEFLGVEFERG